MGKAFFVTGIDTSTGKSCATGYLAREFSAKGYSVITQKFIQTGNSGISEDIEVHRKIMGTELLPEDLDGTTCPVTLSYPASPHLASQIDGVRIDLGKIRNATSVLQEKYDITLIEGAGGIMTPITCDYTTLDYIRDQKFPVYIVTSPKLGSINHTLLTLEACRHEKIEILGVIYNKFNVENNVICADTERYLKNYLNKHFDKSVWMKIDRIEIEKKF
ncbi:MAG: dethiobiotin synthase [Prevotellaceae bacterium]|jgi:dethiobiotin synthetase|nr:dethiobiotin synthase [Prevotellaceae bacterium]